MRFQPLLSVLVAAFISYPCGAQDSPEAVQEAFVDAILAGDVAALGDLYAPDAVSFPLFNQMRVTGPEGVMADWGPFLDSHRVLSLELLNQDHVRSGDIEAAWGTFRMVAVPKAGGDEMVTEGRYMDVSQKIGDRWYYIADHASLPTMVD